MANLGFLELIIICVIALIYVIPVAVVIAMAIWATKTLKNIRADQETIKSRLEAIERAIQNNPSRHQQS
jgi:hypothetical protein